MTAGIASLPNKGVLSCQMPQQYATPLHENPIVDIAGDALIGFADAADSIADYGYECSEIINNWRAAHAYPLNTFQMTLRRRAQHVAPNSIVAQRIKRLSSIQDKLQRYDTFKLAEMQDIAGCRVVVDDVDQVYELVRLYRNQAYSDHELVGYNDYIRRPKRDGYRSYHLIYRYHNPANPNCLVYDGLQVEMQFRSILQHCWATAVEVADIFERQGLKSHRGTLEWHRFFSLAGAAFAELESSHRVPGTPLDHGDMVSELREWTTRLNIDSRLRGFGRTLNVVGRDEVRRRKIKYIVVQLDLAAGETKLFGYRASDLDTATAQVAALERHMEEGSDTVLVSVSDAASLARAYPNYFLDTTLFLETLASVIE